MLTLVFSDTHLAPGKCRGASRMLADLIGHAARGGFGVPAHAVEVVGAGDVFDLDPSYPRSASPEGAADAIAETLLDHPELARELADAKLAGCDVHLVAGNHDQAIAAPEGRAAISRTLGFHVPVWTWYRTSSSGAHVEHGHLYDPANAGQADVTLGGIGARHAHLAFPGLDPEGIDSLHPREYLGHVRALVARDPSHARRAVLAGASFLRCASLVDDARARRATSELIAALARSIEVEHGRPPSFADRRQLQIVANACTPAEFTRARGWDGYHVGVVEELGRAAARIQALRGAPAVVLGHVHRPRVQWVPNPSDPSGQAALMNAGCWSERGGTYAIHNPAFPPGAGQARGGTGPATGVYAWGNP